MTIAAHEAWCDAKFLMLRAWGLQLQKFRRGQRTIGYVDTDA